MRHVVHLTVTVDGPDTASLDDTAAMLRRRLAGPEPVHGGDEIRLARLRAGVSQAELARRLAVTPGYLSLLESSNRTITEQMRSRLEELLPGYADQRFRITAVDGEASK